MMPRRVHAPSSWLAAGMTACIVLIWGSAAGSGAPVQGASAASGGRWALLVVGISGNPELKENYFKQVMELRGILEGPYGYPRDHVLVLFEDPERDPVRVQFRSTREELHKACAQIAARALDSDLLLVVLMGHGSYDKSGYKLNLVGPDPSGDEIAAALYSVPAGRYVVVNTTSASGGSMQALAHEKSIVITATKSGSEKNQTHMGEFFIEALRDGNADADKNGRISVLEAFSYAARKVEEYYSQDGTLQTEHAVLDDDGDGQGRNDPGPANGEGFLARTTYIDSGALQAGLAALNPEERALTLEVQALEKQIEELKYAKAAMAQEEYEKKLEELLIKLAEVNAKLRKK
jgi:hypothetical protein